MLVHGAWVGEWYWQPIVDRLTNKGHVVYAVSLTGHGRRTSEGGPHVGVEDHIRDIVDILEREDLRNVYLVAHSYGGRPATGAWDQARPRIHHIVFVDAAAPTSRSPIAFPARPDAIKYLKGRFPTVAESGMLPVRSGMSADLKSRSSPQSLKTLYSEIRLQNGPLPESTRRTYIRASRNRSPVFRKIADRLRADPTWNVLTLESGHDVVSDAPDELVDLLLMLK